LVIKGERFMNRRDMSVEAEQDSDTPGGCPFPSHLVEAEEPFVGYGPPRTVAPPRIIAPPRTIAARRQRVRSRERRSCSRRSSTSRDDGGGEPGEGEPSSHDRRPA
jgi:hypothetical protein